MMDKIKITNKILNALNANDYDAARKLIENDLKRLGCKDLYYFYSALITQDLNKQKELYTKALTEREDFIDAYVNRGLVFNELKEFDRAIEDYNKAIKIDPKCALAYNNKGYTEYNKKDYEAALKDYNKAILLDPKMQVAIDNKERLLKENQLEDDKDFNEKYYLSLGIFDVTDGAYPEAIKDLDKSIEYNSKQDIAYFYKGIAYHQLGKNEEAYDNYTKSIEINKNMIDAYFNRGQLNLKNNPKLALDDFVTAVSLDPQFIDAYYSIAAIQKQLGEYENAIKNLDKILDIEPNAVNAKALKKLILTKYLK